MRLSRSYRPNMWKIKRILIIGLCSLCALTTLMAKTKVTAPPPTNITNTINYIENHEGPDPKVISIEGTYQESYKDFWGNPVVVLKDNDGISTAHVIMQESPPSGQDGYKTLMKNIKIGDEVSIIAPYNDFDADTDAHQLTVDLTDSDGHSTYDVGQEARAKEALEDAGIKTITTGQHKLVGIVINRRLTAQGCIQYTIQVNGYTTQLETLQSADYAVGEKVETSGFVSSVNPKDKTFVLGEGKIKDAGYLPKGVLQ